MDNVTPCERSCREQALALQIRAWAMPKNGAHSPALKISFSFFFFLTNIGTWQKLHGGGKINKEEGGMHTSLTHCNTVDFHQMSMEGYSDISGMGIRFYLWYVPHRSKLDSKFSPWMVPQTSMVDITDLGQTTLGLPKCQTKGAL